MLLSLRYKRHGIEVVNREVFKPGLPASLLAEYGATIGDGPIIHGPITIHNADADYRNLKIGRRVHIGRGVLLDLSDELVIQDEAVVSMGCTLLTHADIGDRPLSGVYPRQTATTVIGAGAYLGANVTVLAGVTIGEGAAIGAGAVVLEAVPAHAVAVGVPARVVKTLHQPAS